MVESVKMRITRYKQRNIHERRRWGESGGEDEQVPVLGVAAK